MEKLISKTVDTSKADYAVITGVQIHNWARTLDQPGSYSMEFVAPSSCYAVVNGVATHLDLSQIPQVGGGPDWMAGPGPAVGGGVCVWEGGGTGINLTFCIRAC